MMYTQICIVNCLIIRAVSVLKNAPQHGWDLDIREISANPCRIPERTKIRGCKLTPA
jgi:hypothetical protein